MDDRRLRRLGQVRLQPLADLLHHRQLARLAVFPEAEEAADLPLEVAGVLAEAVQPARLPVDRVDLRERVDELERGPPALLRVVELGRISSAITWPSRNGIT